MLLHASCMAHMHKAYIPCQCLGSPLQLDDGISLRWKVWCMFEQVCLITCYQTDLPMQQLRCHPDWSPGATCSNT